MIVDKGLVFITGFVIATIVAVIYLVITVNSEARFISEHFCKYTGYQETTFVPVATGNMTIITPVTSYRYKCGSGVILDSVVSPEDK